jgi:hypothetical protein
MTRLWNERWEAMSFGPYAFSPGADTDGLMGRWVAVLLTPVVLASALEWS